MITKVKFKRLDTRGVVPFKVKETITLPLLNADLSKDGVTQIFNGGGTFNGELVYASVDKEMGNGIFKTIAEGTGLMVVNDDKSGLYLIPVENVTEATKSVDDFIDRSSSSPEVISNGTDQIENAFNDAMSDTKHKVFGFTYKQLAIIGVLLLIVRKL
jgi:hypothetical protein